MLSLFRGLTASISTNISSLKRQAKRLHKASPEVFGHQISHEIAQEAIARANGFRQWAEITELSIKTGLDRNTPFWHIMGRNDCHSNILSALVATELCLNENGPVVFLGDQKDCALPAVSLFAEEISHRGVPGAILIDTKADSFEQTAIGNAFSILGLEEQASMFRVIDLREKTINVAIHAEPQVWLLSLQNILSNDVSDALDSTAASHLFEQLLFACAKESRWHSENQGDIPLSVVSKAAFFLQQLDLIEHALAPFLTESERTAFRYDIQACVERGGVPIEALNSNKSVLEALKNKNVDLGISLWHESERRPVIVLFDRDFPETEVMASAIHAMYHWRYVSQRLIRPTLFSGEVAREALPKFLTFGGQTIIVNGSRSSDDACWRPVTMQRASFATITGLAMRYSGRSVNLNG